jgi:hypothetical protein
MYYTVTRPLARLGLFGQIRTIDSMAIFFINPFQYFPFTQMYSTIYSQVPISYICLQFALQYYTGASAPKHKNTK